MPPMPPPIPVPVAPQVIVLHYTANAAGEAVLAPASGNPIPVAAGRHVVFVAGDPGATDLSVTFTGNSPFGSGPMLQTIRGGNSHRIAVAHSAVASENRYPFDCRVFINGIPVTANGGGELEIGPGGDN